MTDAQQKRATFEDVLQSQKKLRKKFNDLICENRCLNNGEREMMFDLYARATLGLGTRESLFFFENGIVIKISNFEKFVRDVFYWDKNRLSPIFFLQSTGKSLQMNIQISEMWRQIRNKTEGVAAEALAMSIRISSEQTRFGPSQAGEV